MSYVKISDTSIMDLAGIQQIINVVNQHSDYLNALVNRFGADYIPDWTQPDVQANFDIANSNIVYGKIRITPDDDYVTSNSRTYYRKNVTFSTGISFSETPIILLTPNNSDGSVDTELDIISSLHNCSTTGFTARFWRGGIKSSNKDLITSNVEINWIAIGRR